MAMGAAILLLASCSQYKYETVAGDPLGTKIYTLDNGLKVYMSVNKETPRIQTYIAVKVGGKNDPSETTGLAHYFEHLMFKGSENFGTSDYAAEKPLLDEIEYCFEYEKPRKIRAADAWNDTLGLFLLPVSQENSFALEDGRTDIDVRVKFLGGNVLGVRRKDRMRVLEANSTEVI